MNKIEKEIDEHSISIFKIVETLPNKLNCVSYPKDYKWIRVTDIKRILKENKIVE